jgi:glycosyltransferase involved in cell wall biosynthesis
MNVLFLNQFYDPDPAPTGRLLADVVRALAAQGHSVTVICGAGPRPAAASQAAPRIIRIPSTPFSRGLAARLLSYLSFYIGALWQSLRVPRPDVVVTLTTPPLLSLIGTLVRRIRGARHYIWEMDVYPDIAVALGVLSPRSWLIRSLAAAADRCRREAAGVIALGPCMRDRLFARGISANVRIAENWADGAAIRPEPLPPPLPLTILYSGNLGLAHDTETIAHVMRSLKDDPRFRFVFAGGGPRRKALEDFCRAAGIGNAEFTGYKEQDRLSEHLASCHIGLVTQEPASLGAVVPSKVYALMAAGRPILFIGPRLATPARTIKAFGCGWQIDPGDNASAAELLDLLASEPRLIARAGVRAREAFETRYDLPAGVARILDILEVPAPNQRAGDRIHAPQATSHEQVTQ